MAAHPRLDPDAKFGLRFTLIAIAAVLVAIPFGLLLVQVTSKGPLTRVDTSAANHLHHWVRRSPGLVTALKVVTTMGSTWFLTVVVVAASVVLLRAGRKRATVFLVATSVTGGLLNSLIKAIVARPRPSLVAPVATAAGKSFPSGHAMGATVAYGALLVVFAPQLTRRARVVAGAGLVVLLVAISFTRLALGVHYISDVLAGMVLGAAWVAVSSAVFRIWRTEKIEEAAPEQPTGR